MNRFLGVIFLGMMAAGVVSGVAQELSDGERAQFLERMAQVREKQPGARAEFREEKHTHLLRKPLVSEGSVTFLSPNKFRREIRGANPSITVSNGKVLWIYYPKFNEAERYALGERAFLDDSMAALTAGMNFANIEEYYHVRVSRQGDGYKVALAPRRSNMKRVFTELTLWFDEDLILQRSAIAMAKGDQVETSYSRVKRTAIPESEFDFQPPSGANVSTPLGK